MNNDNQEIIDIFLDTTPLYLDVIGVVIEYITPKKFKVGEIYFMYIDPLDTIFCHEVLKRTQCFIDIEVFGLKYRKKIRYDKNDNEYIKLYTKILESTSIL